MVDSISFSSGQVLFGSNGTTAAFDSNKKTLLVPTIITANLTIRAVDTSSTGEYVVDDAPVVLGTCHASANVVLGFIEQSGFVSPIGGTYFVWARSGNMWPDGFPAPYESYLTGPYRFGYAIALHLTCETGQLKAYVKYRSPTSGDYTFPGVTLKIVAWCGTWDF